MPLKRDPSAEAPTLRPEDIFDMRCLWALYIPSEDCATDASVLALCGGKRSFAMGMTLSLPSAA